MRLERVADQIRDVVAMQLSGGRMDDPRLSGVVVTAVRVTRDLGWAYVYFRTTDPDSSERAAKGLTHAQGYLRRQVAQVLPVRRVPGLKFFYDQSIDTGARIESLLSDGLGR